MTRTLEQHDRDERQNQHAQIYTPTNYPLPTYQRKRLNKHKIPMRAYFPANYQVKRRKILLSSKSQFVPTTKHTNLGCGSLQAKRCPTERSRTGKIRTTKETAYTTHWLRPRHPLADQVKQTKLNETKWNCASHPLATEDTMSTDLCKPPTSYNK